VGEGYDQLLDDLVLSHRARDTRELDVRRKELSDKVIAIKCPYAVTPHSSRHGRHVMEMRIIAHGGHGCIQITSELGTYMLLKQIDHGLRCHDIPQP
jgi:hypothetical protein